MNKMLSEKDHYAMDSMLLRVINAHKNGDVTTESVVAGLAHIMAALNIGNTEEAINWFNQESVSYFIE